MNPDRPLNKQLLEYLEKTNLNGKEIAEVFNYSPAAISNYLNDKSADSKLDIIVELFLKLKELENSGLSTEEKEVLEASNNVLRMKCAKYEGEIMALKSMIREMQGKAILQSDDFKRIVEVAVSDHIKKLSS